MFTLPAFFLEDTRNGISVSTSLSLQYTAQADLGNIDGIEVIAFFEKIPFVVTKKNYKVLAKDADWKNFIDNDIKNSYINFAASNTGTLIENANGDGGKVIIDGEIYYAGTVSVSEYDAKILDLSSPTALYNLVELKSFSLPVGGHWEGNSAAKGKIYFSSPNYGYQATKSFTGSEASVTSSVGDLETIAGVYGKITSISKSNLKYAVTANGLISIYDWSINLQALIGTEV